MYNDVQLASVVEVFDFEMELWEKKTTSGTPPPGLYNTAYTTIGRLISTCAMFECIIRFTLRRIMHNVQEI